ncbi:porin [Hydrogenophaga atypica]|uniref:Porin n=1 Tax=Hydrogenophaga atypica TaxID=249409 RepID=A0ABW2QM67_9BURK
MKRTSVLLACAALNVAPVWAQSSLTLFGVAEAQVGSWRGVVAAPVSPTQPLGATLAGERSTGLIPYGINASRIGFRGVEDLGQGVKVGFVLENQLSLDTGATPARAFHRQANLGVTGPWGQLRLGRVYTPWNDVASNSAVGYGDTYDPYVRTWRIGGPSPLGSQTPTPDGQLTGLAGALGLNNDMNSPQQYTHVRMDKSLRYDAPSWGGFTVSAQMGMLDPSGKTVSAQSYALVYDASPWRAGLGYYRQDTLSTYDTATGRHNPAAARRGQLDTVTLALNRDFGGAKLWAMLGQSRYDQFVLSQRAKSREWSVGVTVPWGSSWLLKASVAGSDSPQLQGRDIGVGTELHHLLSKRTTAYGAFSVNHYGELLHGQAERKASIFALGLRHMY